MNITAKEYVSMVETQAPKSNSLKNCTMAFVTGGSICALGEIISTFIARSGVPKSESLAYTSILFVILAAILTGLNVFDNIAKVAGAGTLVPITGFSNALVSPALEFKNEGMITGIGVKMFSIAGPVIVYGISASVIYGLIIFIFNLY